MAEHTVKAFEAELEQLSQMIEDMGGLADAQLSRALDALVRRDLALAKSTVARDARIDELEREVANMAVRILALRQPMAGDLRAIIASIKISADLERIGDLAEHIATRTSAVQDSVDQGHACAVARMGELVLDQLRAVLKAFVEGDAKAAEEVWRRDREVDEVYNSVFRVLLTYMMEDPRNITPCAQLLFVAKNLERAGDHATNVAESIYYSVTGGDLPADRPKGERTLV